SEEIPHQFLKPALNWRYLCFSAEHRLPPARDRAPDRRRADILRRLGQQDRRSEAATSVPRLGLRQIEQVFAFDVAAGHVVADRVADDLAARGDDQSELGFG